MPESCSSVSAARTTDTESTRAPVNLLAKPLFEFSFGLLRSARRDICFFLPAVTCWVRAQDRAGFCAQSCSRTSERSSSRSSIRTASEPLQCGTDAAGLASQPQTGDARLFPWKDLQPNEGNRAESRSKSTGNGAQHERGVLTYLCGMTSPCVLLS